MTNEKTEVERILADTRGAADLAAAKLVNTVGGLMSRAVAASGLRNHEIARDMGVTAGRITQLLAADGNVKLSTLARFMDACGYELKIVAEPKDPRKPSIMPRGRGRRPEATAPSEPKHFDVWDGELTVEKMFGMSSAPHVQRASTARAKTFVSYTNTAAFAAGKVVGDRAAHFVPKVDFFSANACLDPDFGEIHQVASTQAVIASLYCSHRPND